MTHVVPPPKKKYPISAEARRKAQTRTAKLSHQRKSHQREAYVKGGHSYDQRMQRCRCEEKAWNSGEESCLRCGKFLPKAL